jgi:hypothetical protein
MLRRAYAHPAVLEYGSTAQSGLPMTGGRCVYRKLDFKENWLETRGGPGSVHDAG